MKGLIFDIKQFAVHDGPGIRTTVFFSGCPLKCVWCHNPESITGKAQLGLIRHKCVGCGKCATVCPNGAHSFTPEGLHILDRKKCTACGQCAEVCLYDALTVYGKELTIDEVMDKVLEDRDFYESSGGGVTLSGGECTVQADFCLELLKRLKKEHIHTAVDTCGFVSKNILEKLLPYTDLFLYDIKAIDEDVHIKCTGQSNALILDNIKYLSNMGKSIEVRIPFVPDYNSEQIEQIGGFLSTLSGLTGVRLLPYHNYSASKYDSIDMENTSPERLPSVEEMEKAKQILFDFGLKIL